MNKWLMTFSVLSLSLGVVGAGCNGKKTTTGVDSATPAVADLSAAPVPAYTPPAPQQPSDTMVTSTPNFNSSGIGSTPTTGGRYTVKKGETLWKIAAEHYGDGKQHTRILAANPGLTAANLKAGQVIILP